MSNGPFQGTLTGRYSLKTLPAGKENQILIAKQRIQIQPEEKTANLLQEREEKTGSMQKKVVVLGGVGLVGTHLIPRLIERGEEVYCVDTRELNSSPLLRDMEKQGHFHYVRHNIISPFTIRCDQIFNLCTPVRLTYDKQLPVETLKTHLQGSINTLENARTEFARVVYASSAALYSPNPRLEADPRNEHAALSEGIRAAEMIHRAYAGEYGVDCRIARLFNTYGSGADLNDRRVVMRMITAALQNREIIIFGSGEQQRTFCWAGDMARGLMRLMDAAPQDQPRTIDLGSDEEVTIRVLAEKIIDLAGSRSRIHHIDARFGDAPYRRPDLTRAHNELDWHAETPLAEGLKRTIEYAEKMLSAFSGSVCSWVEVYG